MVGETAGRDRARVLGFLAKGEAEVAVAAARGTVLLSGEGRGSVACSLKVIRALCADGLVKRENGKVARVAPAGPDIVASPGPGRVIERAAIEVEGAMQETLVNSTESPLALLARRRGRDGKLFIDRREFAAGERLRRDYTRGQIMPRLGANWVASVACGRRDSGTGGIAELTDAALAARQRVERALRDVGPELSGVLVDVCCFLKGLETVEMEREWPARSAKVVLKAALMALARHYDPPGVEKPERRVLHWGAEGYRPSLG